MAGHGSKLGRKQEQAIAALLSQRTVEDAAHATGVDTKTLLRWMKDPDFDAAYRRARRATVSQSGARLQQATSAAASTLLKIMVDANAPPSTRVRAAESVLSHAAKAIQIEDVELRVAELEKAVTAAAKNHSS